MNHRTMCEQVAGFAVLLSCAAACGSPPSAGPSDAGSLDVADSAAPLDRIVLSQEEANALFSPGEVSLGEHIYVLPVDFTIDLGSRDLDIRGVPGRTTITSFDGTPATRFDPMPLNTKLPDNNPDGLYVVTQHPEYSYGGGFAHVELPYATNGVSVWYTQGTVLRKSNGIWRRHYTGAGFQTRGNVRVSGVRFDSCQFYLFSPFGLETSELFLIEDSEFNNVARVLSSSMYGGVDHDATWHNALSVYPVNGSYRFREFVIRGCTFEHIHTAIVWGFPPSRTTRIVNNTIRNSEALSFFNLMMRNYDDAHFFNDAPQFVTGNTFEDIAQHNNWTTQLIRTSGTALIDGNRFIRTTPQVVLLYGGDTVFTNNVVDKPNSDEEMQSPVILVKESTSEDGVEVVNTFSHNEIVAPHSFFVAVEGSHQHVIEDNSLMVETVFSKNSDAPGAEQFVRIARNSIVSPSMTNVGTHDTANRFERISVIDNSIDSLVYLHTGNASVDLYELIGNRLVNPLFVNEVPQAAVFTSTDNSTP